MNIPGFNAEISLYKTNGYYQTGRAINLSGGMVRTIHAAMEKIEVHSCASGSYLVEYGDGTWDCWTNPDPWWAAVVVVARRVAAVVSLTVTGRVVALAVVRPTKNQSH